MKRFTLLVLVALAFVTFVPSVSLVRADDGRPSAATLADMGLGGMQVISDAEAMSVRGEGITVIKGKHSKVVKFHYAYATPNGHVGAHGFVWAVAY